MKREGGHDKEFRFYVQREAIDDAFEDVERQELVSIKVFLWVLTREQKTGTGKTAERLVSWTAAWNSFIQCLDSEAGVMFTKSKFSNVDPFAQMKHWCLHAFLVLLAVKSWTHYITSQNLSVFVCKSSLAEFPRVSSKCYTLCFLGKENDSYLLEIDQVAPGSSLGRVTAKLGWSLKRVRVETYSSLGTWLWSAKSHVPGCKPSAQECCLGGACKWWKEQRENQKALEEEI